MKFFTSCIVRKIKSYIRQNIILEEKLLRLSIAQDTEKLVLKHDLRKSQDLTEFYKNEFFKDRDLRIELQNQLNQLTNVQIPALESQIKQLTNAVDLSEGVIKIQREEIMRWVGLKTKPVQLEAPSDGMGTFVTNLPPNPEMIYASTPEPSPDLLPASPQDSSKEELMDFEAEIQSEIKAI